MYIVLDILVNDGVMNGYGYVIVSNNNLIEYKELFDKYQSINSLKVVNTIILLNLLEHVNYKVPTN